MAVELEKTTSVSVSATEWVAQLQPGDVAELASAVAVRFDKEFAHRNDIAREFSDGLSELGARFLAEVVTHYFQRQSRQ